MATTDDKHGIGTWVKHGDFWHRSVAFDGYDHDLACDATVAAGDDLQGVQMDTDTRPDGPPCFECWSFWLEAHDA